MSQCFGITVKIGQNIVSLVISEGDSFEDIFDRCTSLQPQLASKKQEVIMKITETLRGILKGKQAKEELKMKIFHLLNKTRSSDKEVSIVTYSKNEIQKGRKSQLRKKVTPQSAFKKQINEDLTRAYQTILKKCKEVPLKEMAKRCLKEMGRPLDENPTQTAQKKSAQRKPDTSLIEVPSVVPKKEQLKLHTTPLKAISPERSLKVPSAPETIADQLRSSQKSTGASRVKYRYLQDMETPFEAPSCFERPKRYAYPL